MGSCFSHQMAYYICINTCLFIKRQRRSCMPIKSSFSAALILVSSMACAEKTTCATAEEEKAFVKLEPVLWKQVDIQDCFWKPRQGINRTVTIPHCLKQPMLDHDLYKSMEAAAYSLALHPDPELEKEMDDIISWIATTQEPDGYRVTHFKYHEPINKDGIWNCECVTRLPFSDVQPNKKEYRFKNLIDSHELYTLGHLCEAAVAYYDATGKRNFLDAATKFADLVDSLFGDAPGKSIAYDGHPEVELALIRLWKATGERRYLELASFFVDKRGSKYFSQEMSYATNKYHDSYRQDDVPIREHASINGHAVRAVYLFSGVTDVARENADQGLLDMLDRVWENATERRMYITGGVGSYGVGKPNGADEAFGDDYELPNLTGYQESCASISMLMWSHRLCLLYGDARYADVMERVLYNAIQAGVSLSGNTFFYANPLASKGDYHRQEWFSCPCCPPNIARIMASLGGYAYAVSDDSLWVNLYIQGTVNVAIAGTDIQFEVKTRYPWDGEIEITPKVSSSNTFGLRLRIPGWCSGASLKLNGKILENTPIRNGYFVLRRTWEPGDQVSLELPMPVQKIEAHPKVIANTGRIALMRGPIVYCLEHCDQQNSLDEIAIPLNAKVNTQWEGQLLGGIVTLNGDGLAIEPSEETSLYRKTRTSMETHITAVPYFAWDNRDAGPMEVWIPVGCPLPEN